MPHGKQAHHAHAEDQDAPQPAPGEAGAAPAPHDADGGAVGRHVQEENERLVAALATVRAAVTLSDPRLPDQPLIYVNAAFTAITGYPAAEAVGRNCRFLQGPETDRVVVAQIRAAIAAGESLTCELLNYRKDGTPFWNEVMISPVRSAEGEVHTFIGLQHDITARKQAEQDRRAEQEQRVRAVTHSTREAVVSADLEGQITFWSTGAQALFGYTEEDALRRALPDLLPVPYRAACTALLASVATGDRLARLGQIEEAVGLRRDGTVFPLEYSLVTGRADGQTSVTAIIRDISERRRAEEQLLFQARLLETVGQAVIATDVDGAIVYWNHAAEMLYGWPAAEAHGRNIRAVMVSTASAQQAEEIMARVQTGQTWTREFLVQHRDGTTFPALVTDSPIYDTAGALAGIIGVSVDISELKRTQEMLTYQALHDALTDLPNRLLLHDRVQQALGVAQREQTQVALLLLDLDRFKEVNDTFGHHAGDVLLQEIARRLQGIVRASDTVARLGGDEFALLLTAVDQGGVRAAAHKIRMALDAPVLIGAQAVHVEGSLGIALGPEQGADMTTLLRHADVAMYTAKERSVEYVIYAPEQDTYTPDRLALIGELGAAIADGGLLLHYQPKVELATGRVVGVEALVRWAHAQRGLVRPDQFIPLAEHTGLIGPLTLWILEEAVRQCQVWAQHGHPLGVAVNLSTRNLQDPTLPEMLAEVLRRYAVPPAQLTLEITESALMADPVRAEAVVLRLVALGVRLSIDDFGTGYSSLAYLKQLPVDEVKIDQSFVRGMGVTSLKDAAIVRSVIDLGHNLGLTVVAEGVEGAAVWDRLRAARCDVAQGYYLSRPVPAAELERWLATGPWRSRQTGPP